MTDFEFEERLKAWSDKPMFALGQFERMSRLMNEASPEQRMKGNTILFGVFKGIEKPLNEVCNQIQGELKESR